MAESDLQHASVKSALRIMDVASELRRQRARAAGQLNIDQAKAEIRERIRATAELTGEPLSDGEIEAAIEHYFSGLYRFKKPARNLSYYLARLYVARRSVFCRVVLPVLLAAAVFAGWRLWQELKEAKRLALIEQQLEKLPERGNRLYQSALQLARSDAAREAAASQLARLKAAGAAGDLEQLRSAVAGIEALIGRLRQEYEVRVASGPSQKSGIDRYYTDKRGQRVSGYYLIVYARDRSGEQVPVSILNSENNLQEKVLYWGERVPKEVYERVRQDKLDNGVIDEPRFGRKRQGELEMEVMIKDAAGKPLEREAQITEW